MSDLLEVSRQMAAQVLMALRAVQDEDLRGLKDQLRRACVSVPSNIAEGLGRAAGAEESKQRDHFFRIALGSLEEALTQIDLIREVSQQGANCEISDATRAMVLVDERLRGALGITSEAFADEVRAYRYSGFGIMPACGCPEGGEGACESGSGGSQCSGFWGVREVSGRFYSKCLFKKDANRSAKSPEIPHAQ